MDEPAARGTGQRGGHLGADVRHLDRFQTTAFVEVLPQGPASDELHDDGFAVAGIAGVEDGDDGGVDEPSGGHRLGAEPSPEGGIERHMGMEDLDRDGSTQHLVVGAPHVGHPAAGDEESEPVSTAQQCADGDGGVVGHRIDREGCGINRAGSRCR